MLWLGRGRGERKGERLKRRKNKRIEAKRNESEDEGRDRSERGMKGGVQGKGGKQLTYLCTDPLPLRGHHHAQRGAHSPSHAHGP